MSTKDGVRLAHGNGPATGSRTSSYRAEAYGMLAMTLFTVRALEYTFTPPANCKFSFFSDGQAMLKALIEMSQWPFYYPNATMHPDWDVLQAIVKCLEILGDNTTLAHVKGHQDDHTSYASLPLPAQLNVQADEVAGSYQYLERDHQRTTLISGAGVLLHTPEGTIGSHHIRRIRSAQNKPVLRKHLCDRHGWSRQLFDSIDWEIHGRSIRKHFDKRHFVCKLVQERLPVGHLVHHYGTKYQQQCPSCDHHDETTEHFMGCPGRTEWHIQLLDDLNKYHQQNHTKPELAAILNRGIRCIIHGSAPPNPEDFPDEFQLVDKQYQLGWKHLFQGRFVKEWRCAQNDHLQTVPRRKDHHKGDTWLTGIIAILWTHMQVNWNSRNDDRHGNDKASREAKLVEQAQREITAIYDNKSKVLPIHRKHFYTDTETHFTRETTSRQLQQWINTWNPLVIHSVKEARKASLQNQSSITDFFSRLIL